MAAGKRTQLQLEDTVLQLLSSASGSLLDNVALIDALDASKATWEEVKESLRVAEETACQLEAAAAQYRPCSTRAALLFFVLNDLSGERSSEVSDERVLQAGWLEDQLCVKHLLAHLICMHHSFPSNSQTHHQA